MMNYEEFANEIYKVTGIDLRCYKENQMKRRMDAFIIRHEYSSYEEYLCYIRENNDRISELKDYITINVSEFFRDKQQWEILRYNMVPYYETRFKKELDKDGLRIWCSACSTGEEPYSLAMILSEYIPLKKIHIYATDIDEKVLETAKKGEYTRKDVFKVPADLRDKYFDKVGDDCYRICESIKNCVKFGKQDLLHDVYYRGYHMILCRNVVIYLNREARKNIYEKMSLSLVKDGILFVGATEQITEYRDLGFEQIKSFFYKKI